MGENKIGGTPAWGVDGERDSYPVLGGQAKG